jgi:hypothetical protein
MPERPARQCRTQSRAIRATSSAKVSVEITKAWRLVRKDGIADHSATTALSARHTSTPIQKLPPKVTTVSAEAIAADAPEAELGERQQAGEAVDQVERRRPATVKISAEMPTPTM